MEKFAVDLDKVLDDFELHEDLASIEHSHQKPNPISNGNGGGLVDGTTVGLAPSEWLNSHIKMGSSYDGSNVPPMIDLSDADFAATESRNGFDEIIGAPDDVGGFLSRHLKSHAAVGTVDEFSVTNGIAAGPTDVDDKSDSISPPTRTTGSRTNVENGIKELHYDEVLNKDFVVTFGRKMGVKSTNIKHEVPRCLNDSISSDPSADQSQCNLDDQRLTSVSSPSLAEEVGKDISQPSEVILTPDSDSSDSAVDVAPVSFRNDIYVTDDACDSYLRDAERQEDDGVDEIPAVSENASGGPMSQACKDAAAVCDRHKDGEFQQIESGLTDDIVSTAADSKRVMVEDLMDSSASPEHGSSVPCLLPYFEDDVVGDQAFPNEALDPDVVYPQHSDETFEQTQFREDPDEGYEADEASPPSDNARLLRPTSLCLTGQLNYHPPNLAFGREDVVVPAYDERLPFSSLVSTAGSPEATTLATPQCVPECSATVDRLYVDDDRILGRVAPVWIPDADAPTCMQCDVRFTVIKRRHHCRACGKVFCAACCGVKAKLLYMDNKEARVCLGCMDVLKRVETLESEVDPNLLDNLYTGAASAPFQVSALPSAEATLRSPNPNNPNEYCSIIPPLEQAQSDAPPPTVLVPVGVLKRTVGRVKGEPKQVMFSDGIRPGGDLTELDVSEEPILPSRRQPAARSIRKADQKIADQSTTQPCLDAMSIAKRQEFSLDDALDMSELQATLQDETADPVVFRITKNLCVLVKIINLDCCIHKICWSFSTQGMSAVGQDEIVVLLEMQPYEKVIPTDIFRHLADVYDDASRGVTVSGMGHSIFSQSFLGSKEHGGFLYVRSTFQCLSKLVLPPAPYLFAVLLQKWETPWAKVFPLRLFLRLGAESRYYPCPLVGTRFRKPVYCEIGHTIMNLLADFRNYQYTLPSIAGLTIHMEDKQTFISFPRNRYDEVIKAINSSIDHVLSLAATFNVQADSHLVCIQGEDGNYHTQAINIKDKPRKVTGASFVVFNGALKTSTGLSAKSSIVEDGLMVQISSDSYQALRQSLRDMKDYVIPCGPVGTESPDEVVHLRWIDDDRNVNVGVESPIDGMPMDGISSIRIHCGTDYVGDGLVMRWTEVYLIKTEDGHRSDPLDLGKISDCLASACCLALTPHLVDLFTLGLVKIGLRATLGADDVGYEIGGCGEKFPSRFMNDLDGELVPAIHNAAAHDGAVILELIFHILIQ